MAILESEVDWAGVDHMNQICGIVGITPPPVREWVNELDFDPEAARAQIEKISASSQTVREGSDALGEIRPQTGTWSGPAATLLLENAECQRSFWGHIGDFLLWLAENLVQLLDYIIDFLRVVVAWITFLITAFAVAAAVVIMIVAAVGGAGIGAIFGALVNSAVLAVAGAIAVLGIIVSLLLAGLNLLVEQLQQVIRDARGSICGKGLPSLPDWDPEGWEPPVWPV